MDRDKDNLPTTPSRQIIARERQRLGITFSAERDGPPERDADENKDKATAKAQADKRYTMEERREEIARVLYEPQCMGKDWDFEKATRHDRDLRTLGIKLNRDIALLQDRPLMLFRINDREPTGLYHHGSETTLNVRRREMTDRHEFADIIGRANMVEFQRLGYLDINRYPELYLDQTFVDSRTGEQIVRPVGSRNYQNMERLIAEQKRDPAMRMNIRSEECSWLSRAINKAARLREVQEENERENYPK
ncbi:hypothetical protein [Botrimarina mediterranea]|uniref:hypothetical protein n=1 Tax=Botrimarina mediterranea TaxID=2528022 RepID=UPI00118BB5E8|nr:hypothetical protein K2D_47110 [Planctomycetes bacterium K2D]